MAEKDPNDLIKEMQEIDPSGESLEDSDSSKRPAIKRGIVAVISLVVIIAIVVVMRNFAGSGDDPAVAEGTEEIVSAETDGNVPVLMPAYDPDAASKSAAIRRSVVLDTVIPNRARQDVSLYIIEQGDNVFSIADKFGLQPESILWGNYESLQDNPREIYPGDKLYILPTDGIYHQVSAGETINSIADNFEVDPDAIVEWPANNLDPYDTDLDGKLEGGTYLIVPGGTRELQDWGPPAISRENPATAAYYGPGSCGAISTGAVGDGVFVWPAPTRFLSGYTYSAVHPAVDIGGSIGDPIYAADDGVVVYAGWSTYGYGNLIVIDHGYGWQTAYAHLMDGGIYVSCGQSVYQGEVIGGLGSTGNSSGPHLHFEMRSELYGKVNAVEWIP